MPVTLNAEQLVNILSEMIATEKAGGVNPTGRGIPYGYGAQMTWTQWKEARNNGLFTSVRTKETSLTPFANSMYGCHGLFSLCGPDEIIGMTMVDDPLVEWIGFAPDTVCEKFIKAWTYTDVKGTADGNPVGNVYGDACDDPPTAEKGTCEFFIGDFGTLRACGETVRIADIGLRKCDKQPTYTIPVEGIGPIRIDNDLDLESIAAAQVIKHELSRLLIVGDKAVTGQFDGLSNLIKTGYVSVQGNRCAELDSVVFDWQNDYMNGAVNGHGSIITKIRDVWRRLRQRIGWTGMGMPQEGDVVLVMPSSWAWELLDEWAFWSFRETNALNNQQVVFRDAYELRDIREKYSKGLYGAGYITIDGFNLHILAHDWMPFDQAAPKFGTDIYLLVRRIGSRVVLNGQYIPVDLGADAVSKYAGYNYFQTDTLQGGRMLRFMKFDNACVMPCNILRPRLYLDAPWAQAVIQNVAINPQFDPISVDPQSNYFITTKTVAEPVTQYWYGNTGWFH